VQLTRHHNSTIALTKRDAQRRITCQTILKRTGGRIRDSRVSNPENSNQKHDDPSKKNPAQDRNQEQDEKQKQQDQGGQRRAS
jgi:hypothetical protein